MSNRRKSAILAAMFVVAATHLILAVSGFAALSIVGWRAWRRRL